MSLRLRLSLGITVVLLLFFAGVAAAEYGVLQRAFLTEIEAELRKREAALVPELQALAQEPAGLSTENVKRVHANLPPFGVASCEVYVQISKADGTILLLSDNLASVQLPFSPLQAESRAFKTVVVAGDPVRLLSIPIVVAGTPRAHLVLGASHKLAAIASRRATQWLVGVSALELGVLLLAALYLLSRGLRPLREVASTAQRIVASGDVSQRVAGAEASDEVGRIAQAFNAVVAKVESLLRAQQQLLADTSHELRNPLTVVRTNVDILDKELDAATRHEVSQETEKEIRRMISLVEDLMLLSKTESTREMRMEPVRLDRLAKEAVEQMRPSAGQRSLELAVEAEPIVLGDEDRLRQVCSNLISNAICYSHPDGRVQVRIQLREDMGVLAVRDNGIGIPAEHLAHIFDRFYRVDSTRGRASAGNGLGLAIARALVEAHGGRIEVQSKVDEETTFTVSIPLEAAKKAPITQWKTGALREEAAG